jgi:hypothetical protein
MMLILIDKTAHNYSIRWFIGTIFSETDCPRVLRQKWIHSFREHVIRAKIGNLVFKIAAHKSPVAGVIT